VDALAIETRELHKRFGSNEVLRGLDLQVPEGSMSVVLGPSGTGKSVLLKHILGLMRPDRGDVLVRGRALSTMSRTEILELRRDMGVLFQDGALYSSMNVFDNVAFPLRQHTELDADDIQEIVLEHLTAVGLANAVRKAPNELSGGMRKRVALARSLVLNPRMLLCDEPDSSLDPVRTALLGELLKERHRALGGTVLVVTHDIGLARLICDHISLMWQGRVLAAGPADAIFASDHPFIKQFLAGDTAGPLGMH
jgi:phospholipid/cholesterol/gamma-HCH transport system ATP-binding protein